MTDLQKEKAIHDYIVSHVANDTSLTEYSPYAALVKGTTVCQGYALLTYKMLHKVGVPVRLIEGSADGVAHLWNLEGSAIRAAISEILGLRFMKHTLLSSYDHTSMLVEISKYYNVERIRIMFLRKEKTMDKALKTVEHRVIQPKILYFGTPVVLLNTLNEDGTTNITPMSSAWALGKLIVLGLGLNGKAIENFERHPECVLNLPNSTMWRDVETLAPLTGKNPVPEDKQSQYKFEKNKFEAAGLTSLDSIVVKPQRIAECPIQIEAQMQHIRVPEHSPFFAIVEVEAVKVHAHRDIMLTENHINPQVWSPLIYNFRHYFGLNEELGKSFRSET